MFSWPAASFESRRSIAKGESGQPAMATAHPENFYNHAYGERLGDRIFLSHFDLFLVVCIA